MDRYIGRLLDDRYEILDIIGSGGMAVVYKARCHRLNRLVAIKILKDENMEDADFLRRFHAESRAVAMLSHPNIVSVFDVSNVEDKDYIVMELIDGITLKQYIERMGALKWRQALHFATRIAEALDHAHSRKLVHRDIKPHNVMVLKNGDVKVTDFGIARMLESDNTMTKEAIGSVHYISPEQAKGGRVDERSDLYSLGVVMYEMITGRTPYEGESPVAVAIAHINGGAPRPSVFAPGIPRGLEQIIMRAMARDAKDRYPNALAMLHDLNALQADASAVFSYEEMGLRYQPVEMPRAPRREEQLEEQGGGNARRVVKTIEKPEEEVDMPKGRMGMVAVLICSVVAVLAIIVFMILLTQKDLLSTEQLWQSGTSSSKPTITATQPLPPVPTAKETPLQAVAGPATTQASLPEKVPVEMQNLVSLPESDAALRLDQMGVSEVQWVYQDSLEPQGTVIGQTIAPGETVDGSQTLYVICAAGAVTKRCTFDMPFRTESYYLTIMLDGRPVVLEQKMEPFCATATFDLTGKGAQQCQLYIDGEPYLTLGVDFSE